MKNSFNFLQFLLLILCFSCSDLESNLISEKDYVTLDEVSMFTTVYDSSGIVNQNQISILATDFLKNDNFSRGNMATIKDMCPIFNENGDTILYAVNFDDEQGFVIVSTDTDFYPIVAYGCEGNYISETDNSLQDQFIDEIKLSMSQERNSNEMAYIASLRMNYFKQKKSIKDTELSRSGTERRKPQFFYDSIVAWNNLKDTDVYTFEDYKQTPEFTNLIPSLQQEIIQNINSTGNTSYGPIETSTLVIRSSIDDSDEFVLLKSRWHQHYPYNSKVPKTYVNEKGVLEHGDLGCTAVAAGQIMKYFEWPADFNWSAMSDTYGNEVTADFLYTLGKRIGIDYDAGLSKANTEKVQNALKSYGYSVDRDIHNLNKVITELKNGFPVYMRGEPKNEDGHAWVCDGYSAISHIVVLRILTLEYTPSVVEPKQFIEVYNNKSYYYSSAKYLHMNWGWKRVPSGFYIDTDLYPPLNGTPLDLNHERKNLINIRPNKK